MASLTENDHPEPDSPTEARLLFAASEQNADLLYATRFFAPDPFACFLHRGRSHLVMNDLEIDRARRQAQVDEVLSLSALQQELRRDGKCAITTAAVLHRLLAGRGVSALLVPFDFPAGLAFQLRRRGLRVRVKEGPFFDQRQIKQPREVRQITRAQRAAEAGLQAGIDLIRQARITSRGGLEQDGAALTAERVKEAINTVLLKLGFVATHTIVAGGTQGCDPHNEGRGPLPAHQPIILDVFPRSQKDGYWGDITRTVVRGRAGEKVRRLYGCVAEGQALALGQAKPGASGRQIHQSVRDFFDSEGFPTGLKRGRMQGFFHGTGHGVGLEIHEPPSIGSRTESILRAGQVVTVEPGLYYPGVGGVRIEDLILITPKGHRNLTRFPKVLEI